MTEYTLPQVGAGLACPSNQKSDSVPVGVWEQGRTWTVLGLELQTGQNIVVPAEPIEHNKKIDTNLSWIVF